MAGVEVSTGGKSIVSWVAEGGEKGLQRMGKTEGWPKGDNS